MRSAGSLTLGERAADWARDVLGSWPAAAAIAALTVLAIVVTVRHDQAAGQVTVLGVALCGLALVELSFVLMAIRRSSRTAAELALHAMDADRRAEAGIAELDADVGRLRAEVVQLTVQVKACTTRAAREERQ